MPVATQSVLNSLAPVPAGRAGRRVGWSRPPPPPPPQQAGPARRAATGRRPDRLGQGPDRPVQALRAKKKGEEDGRGAGKGKEQGKEDERGA